MPAFGDRQLAAITPAAVRDWYAGLLPGKPTMRSQCYAVLRVVLNTAAADELIASNPCRIRGAGATGRVHKIRPASVAELAAIEAAMPERLRLAVPLASWCALRYGEIIELRRHDVDLVDEVIRVRRAAVRIDGAPGGHVVGEPNAAHTATSAFRRTCSRQSTDTSSEEHVGLQRDSLLFPSTPGGTHHLSLSAMYRSWNKARAIAGRPDLRFHDLRHTGLVLAAATGATLAELMARAGHSTVGAALKYQHAAQSRDREIAALLSKLADEKL